MSITFDDGKKLARLARLEMDDAEIERRVDNVNGILGWISQLQEVNTDGVEPLRDVVGSDLHLRVDEINDGGDPKKVLANAPEETQGFYVVPKVVE